MWEWGSRKSLGSGKIQEGGSGGHDQWENSVGQREREIDLDWQSRAQ